MMFYYSQTNLLVLVQSERPTSVEPYMSISELNTSTFNEDPKSGLSGHEALTPSYYSQVCIFGRVFPV